MVDKKTFETEEIVPIGMDGSESLEGFRSPGSEHRSRRQVGLTEKRPSSAKQVQRTSPPLAHIDKWQAAAH